MAQYGMTVYTIFNTAHVGPLSSNRAVGPEGAESNSFLPGTPRGGFGRNKIINNCNFISRSPRPGAGHFSFFEKIILLGVGRAPRGRRGPAGPQRGRAERAFCMTDNHAKHVQDLHSYGGKECE